jgi:subtilisin family serine protease
MKKIHFIFIINTLILSFIVSSLAQTQKRDYLPGQVIVKFKKETVNDKAFNIRKDGGISKIGIGSLDKINHSIGVTEITGLIPNETREMVHKASESLSEERKLSVQEDRYGLERTYIIKISKCVEEAINAFANDPNVEYVGPNHIVETLRTPYDPFYSVQWQYPIIHAPEGWDISIGSSNIKIGIIDSGVDLVHPDLYNNLYQGYDFVRQDTNAMKAAGYILLRGEDYTEQDSWPMDYAGHGSCVAGTAGAVTNNGIGVAGLMWQCKIVPLRAGCAVKGFGMPNTIFLEADIAFAVYWSVGWGVHIINMSFGSISNTLPTVRDAINYAYDTWGMVFVGASGNDGLPNIHYPAIYPKVIAVGGTTSSDFKAPFSNFGTDLDVTAPGTSYSTLYDITDWDNNGQLHDYMWIAGTSFAAPFVSGLAGLILSVDPSLARNNPGEVRNLILNNADKVGGYNYNHDPNRPGHSLELGYGRINVYRTLLAAQEGLMRKSQVNDTEKKTEFNNIKLSLGNYPNPFNPSTQISFSLPDNGIVNITVHNVLGQIVATLINENRNKGYHVIYFNGSSLASGIYFCRIEFGKQTIMHKILLMK